MHNIIVAVKSASAADEGIRIRGLLNAVRGLEQTDEFQRLLKDLEKSPRITTRNIFNKHLIHHRYHYHPIYTAFRIHSTSDLSATAFSFI